MGNIKFDPILGAIRQNDTVNIFLSGGSDVSQLTGVWQSTYITVKNTSAIWSESYTDLQNLSANWQNSFLSVNALSSNWSETYTDLQNLSSNWQQTYTTVMNNSASWIGGGGSDVSTISANWQDTYTTVQSNSTSWLDVYNIVVSNSGTWNNPTLSGGSDISGLSGNWQSTWTTVKDNSSNWSEAYTDLQNLSADWQQTYTTVKNLSSGWGGSGGSDVSTISSNWQSTYTTVQSNSSRWEEAYTDIVNLSSSWGGSSSVSAVDLLFANMGKIVASNVDSGLNINSFDKLVMSFNVNISDESASAHTINATNSTRNTNASFIKYGAGSLTNPANGFIDVTETLTDLDWSTTELGTIQFYVYMNDNSSTQFFFAEYTGGTYSTDFYFQGNNLYLRSPDSKSWSWEPAIGTWYHIALVRSSAGANNWNLYIDGVLQTVAAGSNSGGFGFTQGMRWGARTGGDLNLNGYFDAIRVTKGAAIDPTTFPPTGEATNGVITASEIDCTQVGRNLIAATTIGAQQQILGITQLGTLSGNWNNVYSTVTNLSSRWEEAYTDIVNLSSSWGGSGSGSDVSTISANWQDTYTIVQSNSSNWNRILSGSTLINGFNVELMPGSCENVGLSSEPLLVGVSDTNNTWSELQFNDTTPQAANWVIGANSTTKYLGGSLTYRNVWKSSAISGAAVWQIKMLNRSENTDINTIYDTTNSHIITSNTYSTSGLLNVSDLTFTPISAEIVSGNMCLIQLTRVASNSADTLIGDAKVVAFGCFENTIPSLITGSSGGGLTWNSVAVDTTAVKSNGYIIDLTTGNKTLTLPLTPTAGDIVGVRALTVGSNTATIARNGSNIEGSDNDLVLDTANTGLTLVYGSVSGWVITDNIPSPYNTPVTSIGNPGSDTNIPTEKAVRTALNAYTQRWTLLSGGYTATPTTSSTITTTQDLTGIFLAGTPLQYKIADIYYGGQIVTSTPSLLTVRGATLGGDIQELYYGNSELVSQIPINIPGAFSDASNATLVSTDTYSQFTWLNRPAWCIGFDFIVQTADSGVTQPNVNVTWNGNPISSLNTNVGPTVRANWQSTICNINTGNYLVQYGYPLEVSTVKGTSGDAMDLSINAIMVLK